MRSLAKGWVYIVDVMGSSWSVFIARLNRRDYLFFRRSVVARHLNLSELLTIIKPTSCGVVRFLHRKATGSPWRNWLAMTSILYCIHIRRERWTRERDDGRRSCVSHINLEVSEKGLYRWVVRVSHHRYSKCRCTYWWRNRFAISYTLCLCKNNFKLEDIYFFLIIVLNLVIFSSHLSR